MPAGVRLLPAPAAPVAALALAAASAAAVPLGWGGVVGLVGGGLLVCLALWQGGRRVDPGQVELHSALPPRWHVDREERVALELHNRGPRALLITVAPGCPAQLGLREPPRPALLRPGERRELELVLRPRRRGRVVVAPLELRARVPGALVEQQWQVAGERELKVYPDLRAVQRRGLGQRRQLLAAAGQRRSRFPGADGEFDRLRPWAPGDDLRHVDWKATARARQPITRVYQEERAQTVVVLVDGTRLMATGAAGRSKMDHAITAALSLCWAGLSRGDRVGVGVFDRSLRSWLAPREGMPQFGRAVDLLHDAWPVDSFPSYREAARPLLANLRRRSLVVWITDLLDRSQGEELAAGLRALRGRHLSLVVALDDPAIHSAADVAPDDREALFTKVGAQELLDDRAALCRRLGQQGARVVTLPPDQVSGGLVDSYLQIKRKGLL